MKSETYRLLRKKELYITSVIGLLLIIAAAAILYFSGQYESGFPYATSLFFYSNVIGSTILILIIAFIFNLALTGKDLSLIKQSISFGISRNTIFWSKLILTLSYFLVICVVGLLLMIGLGENLFPKEEQSVSNFLIASFNMLPIMLSGFFMIHAMKMMKAGNIYIIIALLFIFSFSGDLLRAIFRPISGLDELYKYAPSTEFNENLMSFMDQSTQFEFRYWITGIVISVICLLIGVRKFAKQYID